MRLPLLALAVEWARHDVRWCRPTWLTLVLLFLVRFVVADAAIYGAGASSAPPTKRADARSSRRGAATGGGTDHVNGANPGAGQRHPVPAAMRPTSRRSVRHRAAGTPDRRSTHAQRFLPYRYAIPGVATIGSQVRLRELEYFRAQYLGHDTDIQVRVAPTGTATAARARAR